MVRRRLVLIGMAVALLGLRPLGGTEAATLGTASDRRCGNTTPKVQLTFDDAAPPARVAALLDVLAAEGVRAGFFVLGGWARTHPDLMARIRDDGHWVGNHSTNHPDLRKLSDAAIRGELAGGLRSDLLRPPYGSFDDRVRRVAASEGYRLCLWDIDAQDWRGHTAAQMQQTIHGQLRPGAVILLHLHGRHTLAMLPDLIAGIRARGLELDPLSRFSAGTVDPTTGTPLLLRHDGTVLGGPGGTDELARPPIPARDAVALAARPAGHPGQWVASASGGIYALNGAPFHGALGNLNEPVVGLASTPSGQGYWAVARDGGVFAHGDAGFFGSTGDLRLNEPIVSMAATPSGAGYWLVARDGGVFTFGDAAFLGSGAGSGRPPTFVALVPTQGGDGYWLVTATGDVLPFGRAPDVRSATGATGPAVLAGLADDAGGLHLVTDRPGGMLRLG